MGSVGIDERVLGVSDIAAIFHPHASCAVFAEKTVTDWIHPLSTLLGALGKIDPIEQSEFMHWSVCCAFMD